MREIVRTRGLPFGVIYNGSDSEQSDTTWVNAAEAHMAAYEATADPPGHVIFQSWNAYPKTLLPEAARDSFTNLINRYFRVRTQLTLAVDQGTFSGQLSISGAPVAGAPIQFTATPLSGDGSESQYVVEGITPGGVRQMVLGLRVNIECGCSGPSDFRVRGFLVESGDISIRRDFAQGLDGWGVSERSAATVEDGQLHVQTSDGQALLLNSAPLDFRWEGQPFKLTVTATVSPISAGSGTLRQSSSGARN